MSRIEPTMSEAVGDGDPRRPPGRDEAAEPVSEGSRSFGRRSSALDGRPASGRDAPGHVRAGVLRTVNEQIRALSRSIEGPIGFHCECGGESCNEIVELHALSYDVLYASTDALLLAVGHERTDAPAAAGL
jgi:hypothetical protein